MQIYTRLPLEMEVLAFNFRDLLDTFNQPEPIILALTAEALLVKRIRINLIG